MPPSPGDRKVEANGVLEKTFCQNYCALWDFSVRFRRSAAFLLVMSRLARSSFLAALLAFTAARADEALEASVPFGGNAYALELNINVFIREDDRGESSTRAA